MLDLREFYFGTTAQPIIDTPQQNANDVICQGVNIITKLFQGHQKGDKVFHILIT